LPPIKAPIDKTAYLTFDDGPSARTLEVLDILKEEKVKATFFVLTENTDVEVIKRIQMEGHT
jgi:peptidoglycan/xylan/chitin deacetylase (PgdA/CDA1 family)